jgi:hypothetical protein
MCPMNDSRRIREAMRWRSSIHLDPTWQALRASRNARLPDEESTENELIRVPFQSESAEGSSVVRWQAQCVCGRTNAIESRRPKVPALARCGACGRLLVPLR